LLRLFRRKTRTDESAVADTPEAQTPEPLTPEPAPAGDQPAKKRRRRGSRGGRGRKKPAAQAERKTERKQDKPERKEDKPQRKEARKQPAQRQRRSPRRRPQPRRAPLPPAKRELLVSVDVGEQRVAVVEDDQVGEVYLERPERRSIAGNIYKGIVDNVLPGMEAAFVEIGLEKNGFLYVDEIVVPELEGRRHGLKIQDLLSRGQEILVQAVKDPMKSKGARLTTQISLPGRFVVFVPSGEGLGVSRRLDDDERSRLRDILKSLEIPTGGVIVRTAAEGASAEDIERDLVFLQRLWKTIEQRAKTTKAPALVYQEAELPLRVVRDLFTDDFERALVDDERTFKRIVGYLKKTSPHMVDRVIRYRDKTPLGEAHGVDEAIRSTLSRRVDLPSGGYLVFDYAEAFTVIDVNTGRFVGSRSKTSGGRLEETITKNNLEAVKEVVRQLRLRDIGGIIVIDFIDMANPKNRAAVEAALKTELERDRTKTYVVEISPLGLVEMTRQNVTDGPREIITRKCPVCEGDGIVLSEASVAIDVERKLRALARRSRHQAYRVAVNAHIAAALIGPGAARLKEVEERAKRRFLLDAREDVPIDYFEVLGQGTVAALQPEKPAIDEGAELSLKLVEVGLHDVGAGVGTSNGMTVCVGNAAKLVGKRVKVRAERVLDGTAYATLVGNEAGDEAITAESEAEKPTRQPRPKKASQKKAAEKQATPEPAEAKAEEAKPEEVEAEETAGEEKPKKKTRRGSRGGRGRKKKTTAEQPAAAAAADEGASPDEPAAEPKIHLPDPALRREESDATAAVEASGDGAAAPKKKRTRRGTRGGRNRRKKAGTGAEATQSNGPATDAVSDDYVPMSEWSDEFEASESR
jgi:ribonuclease G